MAIEREVFEFRCDFSMDGRICGRLVTASPGRVPHCGETQTFFDESRFPDGSYIQIRTTDHKNHGEMTPTGNVLQANPFQGMLDKELARAERDVPVC